MEQTAFFSVWLVCFVVSAALGLAAFLFWIWMLADCLTKETSKDNLKLIWGLVIALTNVIGALLYFFLRRPQRRRELGV